MEMVNIIPTCTVLLTVCNPLTDTVTDSVNGKQSTYINLDSHNITELEEGFLTPPKSRSEMIEEILEEVDEYLALQEQLRLEEEERLRLEEEERIRKMKEYPNKGYRQTYYSVAQDGEANLGAGYNYRSSEIKNINNVMHFYDGDYGYLPIYAINLNEILDSGLNRRGTPNAYGSVIEVTDGEKKWKGIVLDACGACRYSPKIDLWVYQNQQSLDITGLDFKYIRYGWNDYLTD